MTPVEACKALNENSVNAVRRLAEYMGVDPVGLSGRLDLVALVQQFEQLLEAVRANALEMNSPEIDLGDPDIPPHQWHEEWLYHARAALTSLRGDQ